MSKSMRPHRWKPTRLLRAWDSPGKITGVGCYSLLQGIFLTRGTPLVKNLNLLTTVLHNRCAWNTFICVKASLEPLISHPVKPLTSDVHACLPSTKKADENTQKGTLPADVSVYLDIHPWPQNAYSNTRDSDKHWFLHGVLLQAMGTLSRKFFLSA